MAGFRKSGTDLDSLFEPRGSFAKRADVNFRISGSDISNNYASASDGTPYGTTSFLANGTDIGTLFAAIGTTVPSGSLWTWGSSSGGDPPAPGIGGALGDNTIAPRSSPVQTIAGGTNWRPVIAKVISTSAPKTDGTLWTWGTGANGILGDNTTTNRSSPVQTIASGTNWKEVATGVAHHTGAIKTDGTLWMWGLSGRTTTGGALGDNTTTNRSSPVQTIASGTNWKQVSVGFSGGGFGVLSGGHTGAIKTDGTLWMWGCNLGNNQTSQGGALGDNTTVSKSSPVQTIAGGTNWKQVSTGMFYSAAIKTDGTLWTWGLNSSGQLGDNTTVPKSSPVQTIAGGTNWKQVSAGTMCCAAIKTDGTLWTWGYNNYGQLGDNTTVSKSSPVQTIAGGTNWKQVSVGGGVSVIIGHTGAIKTDGTLWMWGINTAESPALGDNTNVSKSSPVQTIAGGTNWKHVSAGASFTAAIKS